MLPDSLRPYAKAVYPFVLTLIAVLGQIIATGEFDRAEFATALTGALTSLAAFLALNQEEHVHDGEPVDDDGKSTFGTVL